MNAVEKIIAAHSSEEAVCPGQIVDVELDYIMANDACGVLAIEIFENELKAEKVCDPAKVVLVMDHYTPSSSVDAADTHNKMRDFAKEQGLPHVYDGKGVCHQIMLEKHVCPGQIIIGADSHTCTYGSLGTLATGMGSTDVAVAWKEGRIWMKVPESIKINVTGEWPQGVFAKDLILKIIGDITAQGATYKAVCFAGPAVMKLSIAGRSTLCNMVIEAGAKFAYIQPDQTIHNGMKKMGRIQYTVFSDDEDASYSEVLDYDVCQLVPQISCPHNVDNVCDISPLEGVAVNELFLGACTNGNYEDLKEAAAILQNRTIAPSVRMLVTPASKDVYLRALESGFIKTFIESGAMVSNPGCSACFGGSGGILGKGERLLTTANRNFLGRVGSPDSEIYLASPAVIAASAINGKITDPRRENI